MLDAEGQVKVADFGLAQVAGGQLSMRSKLASAANPHPGTPAYMSPEHNNPKSLLPTADIYSLGCVAFELLTGRLWLNAQRDVSHVRELRPDVPDWLDVIVARMLLDTPGIKKADRSDPNKRFVDCTDVLTALQAGIDAESTQRRAKDEAIRQAEAERQRREREAQAQRDREQAKIEAERKAKAEATRQAEAERLAAAERQRQEQIRANEEAQRQRDYEAKLQAQKLADAQRRTRDAMTAKRWKDAIAAATLWQTLEPYSVEAGFLKQQAEAEKQKEAAINSRNLKIGSGIVGAIVLATVYLNAIPKGITPSTLTTTPTTAPAQAAQPKPSDTPRPAPTVVPPTAAPTPPRASVPETIRIYSSFPLQGSFKSSSDQINNAIKIAIEQNTNNGLICNSRFRIDFVPLDDSTAAAGKWDAATEQANATKAVADKDAMVYIGTLNSGAAKVSIPILNQAKMGMISPANTYDGITTPADAGEPNKYGSTGIQGVAIYRKKM